MSDQPVAQTYTLLLTTLTTDTSTPPAGFEPTIPASEQPQTHALDRAATGIGKAVRFNVRYAQCDVLRQIGTEAQDTTNHMDDRLS